MPDTETQFPGYASYTTPEARERRDALSPELKLAAMEVQELLATNPRAFESRTTKLPVGSGVYVYEHPHPLLQVTYQLIENSEPQIIKFVHFVALKMEVKKTVFISYSHEDQAWLEQLVKFLKGLESEDLALWDDRQIKASDRWRDEIDKALADARAAVLLISQDFLNSAFIQKEELPVLLRKAEREGLKVFWIPVRPSTVKDTPVIEFQAAVDDPSVPLAKLRRADREEQLVRVYEKIAEALAS